MAIKLSKSHVQSGFAKKKAAEAAKKKASRAFMTAVGGRYCKFVNSQLPKSQRAAVTSELFNK